MVVSLYLGRLSTHLLSEVLYPSWILKIDQNGASEWDQIYGRGRASVQQTSDGGFVTVGWITDIDPYGYWNNYAMIKKTDESGFRYNKIYLKRTVF